MGGARAARGQADAYLRAEGSSLKAAHASRNRKHGVWVVSYHDPSHPNDMLIGGALVVTDEGEVHGIGSTPDAVDLLMESLGRYPLGDADDEEGLAALFASRPPWPNVLSEELSKPYFAELMRFVDRERQDGAVYPSVGDHFAALHLTPYEEVKVVILGQDPYHQPGQANGLSFSVPRGVRALPPSLRSIYAAMDEEGFTPPTHGDLTGWAQQGVLLLNTALSVRDSEPNSHAKQWREFTDAVVSKLSDRHRPVIFVLWGNSAHRKRDLISEDRHEVITAPHPAARGRLRASFREAGTFTEVNRRLQALQSPPIDWAIA